jgi:cell fate (sporulation/competence/biofilm development) regulator YlbF (YheA/YmcA/DUF963 family)
MPESTHPKPTSRRSASSTGLIDEINMLKDGIRQVFDLASEAQEPVETLRLLETLGITSVRLARLLKVQQDLAQDTDEVSQAISTALEEILKDWNRT